MISENLIKRNSVSETTKSFGSSLLHNMSERANESNDFSLLAKANVFQERGFEFESPGTDLALEQRLGFDLFLLRPSRTKIGVPVVVVL